LRILETIAPSKIAGAERSTVALCRGLAQRGHDVQLACREGQALIEVARSEGVDVVPWLCKGKRNLRTLLSLAQFARRHRAELICTQLSRDSYWGGIVGRWLGIPVISTVRALNKKGPFLRAQRLIAVSLSVKEYLIEQGVAAERIDVVYNGIDPNRFLPPIHIGEAKRAVGIGEDTLVIGHVAHLTKKKGHEWFLNAAAQVATQVPQAKFLLLGEGTERASLEHQASTLGITERVIFAGFHSDVRPWMAAMDVLTLPSIATEGFGRVLIEAASMEKPTVASTIGGMPEVIAHGETGFIVPVSDVDALAHALSTLLQDSALRQTMGQAGRQRVLENFSEEKMVSNTEKVYESVMTR